MTRHPDRLVAIFAFLLLWGSSLGWAADPAPTADESIRISEAWARLQPPSSRVTGAYMKIENRGDQADVLLRASCACAETVELHVMEEKDGMMSMRHVERFDLAAGSTLELAPGGAHIMVMGLKAALEAGRSLRFVLEFEKAGKIEIDVPIRDPRLQKDP